VDKSDDFVRLELSTAFSAKIPVIPVLVQGASMPTEQELPDTLKPLTFCNAVELRHSRFADDLKHLVASLPKVPGRKTTFSFLQ
jgi:hypothetical protein